MIFPEILYFSYHGIIIDTIYLPWKQRSTFSKEIINQLKQNTEMNVSDAYYFCVFLLEKKVIRVNDKKDIKRVSHMK